MQAQLSDDVMQAEREGKVSVYRLVGREGGRGEGREDGARGGGGVGTDGTGLGGKPTTNFLLSLKETMVGREAAFCLFHWHSAEVESILSRKVFWRSATPFLAVRLGVQVSESCFGLCLLVVQGWRVGQRSVDGEGSQGTHNPVIPQVLRSVRSPPPLLMLQRCLMFVSCSGCLVAI